MSKLAHSNQETMDQIERDRENDRPEMEPPMTRWTSMGISTDLELAIQQLQLELPGWWWSVGCCQVSADATVGPTLDSPDAHLLKIREFDEGFDCDLAHPATPAEALRGAIAMAKAARNALSAEP